MLLFAWLLLPTLAAGDDLALAASGQHEVELTQPAPGLWQATTTGGDPWVLTAPSAVPLDLQRCPVLSFEYLSVTGVGDLQVFLDQPWSEQRSVHAPLPAHQGWSTFDLDLTEADLDKRYLSVCDPRLNYAQALEMAFRIGRWMSTRR